MKKNSKYFKQSRLNPLVFEKKLEENQKKIDKLKASFDHKYQALENFLTLLINFASHDIKNTLHNLDGMVSTLKPKELTDQEILDMKMCIDHMRDTLTKFGEFSVKNKGKSFEIGNLFQSLEILHRPYLQMDKVKLEVIYSNFDKGLNINQDFQLILLMFNNMIINSLTALKSCHDKKLRIILEKIDENIEVLICDNGLGIPEENKTKVFDAYFTTKDEGTGVGLTHVQYVVEQILKSQIFISEDKIEDFITIFKLTIPIKSDDAQNIDN